MHQMLGNLFFRNQSIDTLNDATFSELRYWNNWHNVINKEIDETTRRMIREAGK